MKKSICLKGITVLLSIAILFTTIPFISIHAYSASIELSSYFEQNINDIVKQFNDMNDVGATDGSTEFSNGILTMGTLYDSQRIGFISIDADCEYTISGISFGTNFNTASNKLISDGWNLIEDKDTYKRFINNKCGRELSIWAQNKSSISGISIWVLENIEDGISLDIGDNYSFTGILTWELTYRAGIEYESAFLKLDNEFTYRMYNESKSTKLIYLGKKRENYKLYDGKKVTVTGKIDTDRYYGLSLSGDLEISSDPSFFKPTNPPQEPPKDTKIDNDPSFEIVSNRPSLSLFVGEKIQLGARFKDEEKQKSSNGKISFVVQDTSILNTGSMSEKGSYQYVSLSALKTGTSKVRINDTETGDFVEVTINISSRYENIYTVYNVPKFEVGNETANVYDFNGLYIDGFYSSTNTDGSCDISFDAYNANYIYGIVEIYNADGSIRDCILINKGNKANAISIKEAIWDGVKQLVADFTEKSFLTYKQATGYASKTTIDIKNVEKGGYIKITNDCYESGILALINLIDISFGVKSTVDSFKDLSKVINNLEVMNSVSKSVIKSDLFLEAGKSSKELGERISKKVMKKTVTGKESIGTFLDSAANTLNEMNFDEIILQVTRDAGISIAEKTFLKFTGPAGVALSSMFAFNSMTKVATQILYFQNSEFSSAIEIQVPKDNARSSARVTAEFEKPLDKNVALSVFKIVYDQEAADRFFSRYSDNISSGSRYFADNFANRNLPRGAVDAEFVEYYNITFLKDGIEVQPDSPAKVSIPIPSDITRGNTLGLRVYRVEENGSLTNMNASFDNGRLTFTTDHFSYYLISSEDLSQSNSLTMLIIIIVSSVLAVAGLIFVLILVIKMKNSSSCKSVRMMK